MTTKSSPRNQKTDLLRSAEVITRLAAALKNTHKHSITPDELFAMGRILIEKAKNSHV